MSDPSTLLPIAAASGVAGIVGGVLGAAAAIYARGRADGRRDQVIDDHGKRLDAGSIKIQALEVQGAGADKALAVLSTKMDAIGNTVDETRELVRDLAKRR